MLRRGAPMLSIERTMQMPCTPHWLDARMVKVSVPIALSNCFKTTWQMYKNRNVSKTTTICTSFGCSSSLSLFLPNRPFQRLSVQSEPAKCSVHSNLSRYCCISELAVNKISPIKPSPLRASGTNSKFGATALSIGRSCTAVPFRPSVLAFVWIAAT